MRFNLTCPRIVALFVLGAGFCFQSQLTMGQTQDGPQSRYRFVETKRKTTTPPVPKIEVMADVQVLSYETVEQPPFEREASPALAPVIQTGSSQRLAISTTGQQIGLAPANANAVRRIGLEPVDSGAVIQSGVQLTASQGQIGFDEVAPPVSPYFQQRAQAHVAQAPQGFGGVQQGRAPNSGSAFIDPHPVPVDRFPFQDQYRVFANPRNFDSVNFTTNYGPTETNILGKHQSECCDEWRGFCRTRDLDYGCNCGGLKANPGHLGIKSLGSGEPCDCPQNSKCGLKKGFKSGCGCSSGGSCGCGSCGGGCSSCGSGCSSNRATRQQLFGYKKNSASNCEACQANQFNGTRR